jgi:hypothetical protein
MTDRKTALAWAGQSAVTDPGAARAAIDELPADFAALREAASHLEFHYRAGGDFAANGVPADRAGEIGTRYADAMFALLLERGEPALSRPREPADRVVGCCRDATVMYLALVRHKGIPARARVGFAAYLHPGWLIDHVVAEVWDEAQGRWRLVDPEMSRDWTPEVNGRPVDWTDLAGDQFVTAPRAWRAAQAGQADPERHVVAPELDVPALRGWPCIARNVIHDLAALNKTEMLPWDAWGMQLRHDPGVAPDAVAALAARDGLRVPPAVTSFDPRGGPPREVTLRAAGMTSPA